uniref:Uncharacterized protein n=1 Tax=Anopheles stephensi TaxID=30069 RepID=A0A182YCQ1_ANOST
MDVSKLTTDQPNHPVNSHSTFFAVLHGGVSVLGQICQRRRIVKFFLERFQDPIASNAEDKNVCIAQSGHDRDGTVADRVALGLGFAAAQQSARVRLRAQRFAGCHCSESIVAAYDE